jgi:hypothetical protein
VLDRELIGTNAILRKTGSVELPQPPETVTVADAVAFDTGSVTVIVAVPAATPVTTPLTTVAIDWLLEDH